MVHCFAKVSEEEIVAINETAFFYPSDLVNTNTTIPLSVGEEWWIYPPLFTTPYIQYTLSESQKILQLALWLTRSLTISGTYELMDCVR